MATGITGRSFLAVVKRSGVVSEEVLQRAVEDLQKRNIPLDDPDALAGALIEVGVVTRWQAEKMLQGKHKGFFLGPYRLLDMLGKGGMGAVYLAEHTLMRRRCAIKVLPTRNIGSRSYLERFYREAQAVAAMDHKNIVRAYDVNQAQVGDADVHFLAMEYVEGRDLQRLIDDDGVLRYTEAAEYMRQAAEGLAHAHEAGMVHRDIKPANLLVNLKGVVKILDLGLAKFYDDAHEASLTVAHQETVLGTADYLAPEQAVDSHKTDHRADIYSLGCTFYFLLTGHPPFCEGSVANRLLQHQIKPPPPIRDDRPDAPDSLLAIIDRMMAKDREHRYQSAHDVAEDLTVWLAENGDEAWREQNAELVRKVGESWRSDTQIGASMVDTAELDLRADDDLDLAPLENGEEPAAAKESPLVADETPSSPAAKADSGIELKPATKPAGGTKETAAKPPAAKAAPEQPAPLDLPPLEETTPLDNLQSLDVLSSEFAADQPNQSTGSDASVLSSGVGLTAPAPASSGAKKKPAESSIPMAWIIAIAAVGVVVVLGVLLMIIFGSSTPRPAVDSPGVTTSASARPVERAAEAVPATTVDASTASEAAPAPDPQPAPEQAASPAPPAEAVADESKKERPEENIAEEQTASPSEAPAPPTSPADPPEPSPAPQVETAVSQTTAPRDAVDTQAPPEPQPAAEEMTEEAKKRLLAGITDAAVEIEGALPESIREELTYEIAAKFKDGDIRESANSVNRLHVAVRIETNQPQQERVRFTLTAEMIVPGPDGQPVAAWSNSLVNDSPSQSYRNPRTQRATLPKDIRREVGIIFRSLIVAKKQLGM
jgi:eukaryotic-like serine/threonine-protein kinase